ncbi:hypothetical protein BC827DRAFT_1387279 [Russula dissimulans]|nr:hypothetical protein BC827DRAFT_1387279 [Russula dissimulans]
MQLQTLRGYVITSEEWLFFVYNKGADGPQAGGREQWPELKDGLPLTLGLLLHVPNLILGGVSRMERKRYEAMRLHQPFSEKASEAELEPCGLFWWYCRTRLHFYLHHIRHVTAISTCRGHYYYMTMLLAAPEIVAATSAMRSNYAMTTTTRRIRALLASRHMLTVTDFWLAMEIRWISDTDIKVSDVHSMRV